MGTVPGTVTVISREFINNITLHEYYGKANYNY
jgi:hypothetical protein